MAKRGAGISGVALLLTAAGVWLVYVGVRDVPPVGGLREILRGDLPAGRASRQDFTPERPAGVGKGTGTASKGSGQLVFAYGIRVDSSIAGAVETLVRGALPNLLTGSGYRSTEDQARLRREHCCHDPNSSRCSCGPPTAPVGESMHQQGLAIDFSWNGSLIRSSKSAGFAYLAGKAPGVGLHNLPSEPWHWSTNGK